MKTAKQARRIADQAAGKLPDALRTFTDLRRAVEALGDGLVPEVRAVLAVRLDVHLAALLKLEDTVGVMTPAALFE